MHIYVTRIECSKSKRSAIMGVGGLQTQTDSSWRIAFRLISLHDVRRCRCRCRKAILFWLLQLFIGAYAVPSALESKCICGKRESNANAETFMQRNPRQINYLFAFAMVFNVHCNGTSRCRSSINISFHPVYGSSYSMICPTSTNHDILCSRSSDKKMANDKYSIFKFSIGFCFVEIVLGTKNECFFHKKIVNHLIPTTITTTPNDSNHCGSSHMRDQTCQTVSVWVDWNCISNVVKCSRVTILQLATMKWIHLTIAVERVNVLVPSKVVVALWLSVRCVCVWLETF